MFFFVWATLLHSCAVCSTHARTDAHDTDEAGAPGLAGGFGCPALHAAWKHAFVPHHTNPKPLVLCAGEGTTGTHTIARMIATSTSPEKRVMHYGTLYGRGERQWDEDRRLGKKTITGAKMTHKRRQAAQNRGGIKTMKRLRSLGSAERQGFDFDVFGNFDGVADLPVPQLFPYLIRTYPNAKVVLSLRNASEWVASRAKKKSGPRALALLGANASLVGIDSLTKSSDRTHGFNNVAEDVLAYELHNTLVRCLVQPRNLLEVNLFETSDDVVRRRIHNFLAPAAENRTVVLLERL